MPANAITSASSVERGRWKFVSRRSTRRNSKPGVMKRSVRPASGAPRASVSSTRTVVVPTARTRRRRRAIRSQAARLDRVALAVELVLLERLDRERPEGVEADVEGDALHVEPREQLGREVEPGGRRRRRARRRAA